MNDHALLRYQVGALLYCPANIPNLVQSLVNEKFGQHFSLALCLEDTIPDNQLESAQDQLILSLTQLFSASKDKEFFMPLIFIRVREPGQLPMLYARLGEAANLLTGFILPKFSPVSADAYILELEKLNRGNSRTVYMMPIMESPVMIDLRTRYSILYDLKGKLDQVSPMVLNVRVGGNDLCHAFGYRRHSHESIHDITPVFTILSDILTVFGMDYVVSGPVWEYYNGDGWDTGLIHELKQDRLSGFVGKTVIHPKQIPLVNQAYQVSAPDHRDALSILNWDGNGTSLVSGSQDGSRMNEYKTHSNWARKILLLAQAYGIRR